MNLLFSTARSRVLLTAILGLALMGCRHAAPDSCKRAPGRDSAPVSSTNAAALSDAKTNPRPPP